MASVFAETATFAVLPVVVDERYSYVLESLSNTDNEGDHYTRCKLTKDSGMDVRHGLEEDLVEKCPAQYLVEKQRPPRKRKQTSA